jgi:hypothetical protein
MTALGGLLIAAPAPICRMTGQGAAIRSDFLDRLFLAEALHSGNVSSLHPSQ